ncbi:cytochrome P450 [Streptomyces sp. NBC_00846]|uniref:cytochrome P450 n=1 Tax=Streptomyces sp. NBC_00846 TaxID=2975849 RepID=UPI0038652096|nr:cytochrome P450 [Streptomyces sp. NBC_00846]
MAPSTSLDLFDDAHLRDPYPAYAALREMGPAVRLIKQDVWAIPRYAHVHAVLHDSKHFVSENGVALTDLANREILAGTVLASDGDQHVRLRRVLSKQLSLRSIKHLEQQTRARADQLVDEHTRTGTPDAAALARHMVSDTVMGLMGLPEEVRPRLIGSAAATFDVFGPEGHRYQQALPAASAMVAFLHENVTRDTVAEDSWMGAVFRAVDAGDIQESDAIPLASAYTAAAIDTTILGLTETIRQLAQHPKQWAMLRQDPTLALAENAFHEALRREAPIQGFGRLTAERIQLGGTWIEAGEQVWLLYGSTGRDTDKWGVAADTFNIRRPNASQHLAFGSGRHLCAGIPLALMQARALLGALASRCTHLGPAGEPNRVLNNLLRGWWRVPITAQVTEPSPRSGQAHPAAATSRPEQPS